LKYRLVILIIVVSFVAVGTLYVLIDYSNPTQNDYRVLLQLQHRDSDGNLISYVEGTKIVFIKSDKLDQFLDSLPNKKMIEKDGKNYEMFQWIGPSEKFSKYHAWSGYELRVLPVNNQYQTVLMVLHNAYETQPGDTASIRWTVLRLLG